MIEDLLGAHLIVTEPPIVKPVAVNPIVTDAIKARYNLLLARYEMAPIAIVEDLTA